MKQLFRGGIHPDGHKEMSRGGAVVPVPAPETVVIPLCQHIGSPCKPLVSVGDAVLMGQKIGDGEGRCSPVHSSVSGTVTAIEERAVPSGGRVLSVIIKNDFKDTPAETKGVEDYMSLDARTLADMVREAGIVGMGGAAFPTNSKIGSTAGKTKDVLINACECEPYITADDALLCSAPERVLRGASVLRAILQPDRVVLAVEDNKTQAIDSVRRCLEQYPGIELAVLPTRYPQGAEKQLVQAVTGRQVPPGKLPISVGCGVFNAGTVAAICRAVFHGEPITRRVVTVTGEGVREPKNLIVRIGTSYQDVLAAAGGLTEDACKVIAGGPMMGIAQGDLSVPVLKGTNAVLCLTRDAASPARPVCIRCGKCVEACPMHLQPLYLYRYEAAGSLDALEALHVSDCIECGCCSYVCPGQLPLVERFRAAKQTLKEGNAS